MNNELRDLLENNGLNEYIDLFESNRVFDISTFNLLSDSDFEKIGVSAIGDRKRLLALANKNDANPKALVVYSKRQQMKENIKEDHSYLKTAFTKINDNIDDLFEMKDEMKGILIFKRHKYTADELLTSTQYERIKSYMKKIDDDIHQWKQNGELTFSLRNTYNENRELLIERLERFQDAIEKREPTWWEKVKNFFVKIMAFIAEHLPALWNGLMIAANGLKNHKFLGAPARALLSLNRTVQKILISKKNIYITNKKEDIIEEE